jgi:hypothetical protein
MMFRTALLASAIGLCCIATAALADPPIGSRLGDRLKANAEDEQTAARHSHELANCLVNKRRAQSERLVGQTTSDGYKAAYKAMIGGDLECFNMFDDASHLTGGRSFSIPPEVLRGLLAEHLIAHDWSRFAALPVLPRQMVYARPWFAGTNRHVAVDEMATCVSETAPAQILALLKSEPYSDAEQAAYGALGPHLGACLRVGAKVDANRQTLRAALADALYQRVANPPPAAVTVPNQAAKP